jgi:hypothetical protein
MDHTGCQQLVCSTYTDHAGCHQHGVFYQTPYKGYEGYSLSGLSVVTWQYWLRSTGVSTAREPKTAKVFGQPHHEALVCNRAERCARVD